MRRILIVLRLQNLARLIAHTLKQPTGHAMPWLNGQSRSESPSQQVMRQEDRGAFMDYSP